MRAELCLHRKNRLKELTVANQLSKKQGAPAKAHPVSVALFQLKSHSTEKFSKTGLKRRKNSQKQVRNGGKILKNGSEMTEKFSKPWIYHFLSLSLPHK